MRYRTLVGRGGFMEALTPWHLALILVGFVLLFGYKRLPEASRSVGRSLRIFKSEMREMSDGGHSGAGQVEEGAGPSPLAGPSVEELEQQAREAEAEAAALRARARTRRTGS